VKVFWQFPCLTTRQMLPSTHLRLIDRLWVPLDMGKRVEISESQQKGR